MKTKLVFEIDELDGDLVFGAVDPTYENNYLSAGSDGEEDAGIAKSLKLAPEAVKAIREAFACFAEKLVEKLHQDLSDLYRAIPGEQPRARKASR